MPGNLKSVLTVQQRIAELAQRSPDFAFFSLAHHIDLYRLEMAYHRTRKDGAAGIDDVTGKQYAENLHENLQNLLDRLKSGRYHYERRRKEKSDDDEHGSGEPETFDLLGFTHYWGKTQKGGWAVMRKTMKSRIVRSVQKIDQWCRENRHKPIREQWRKLCAKVRGHYGYYGITGNIRSLGRFLYQVCRRWQRRLNRRNNRRDFTWERLRLFLERHPLPLPMIVHSVFQGK